MARCTRLSGVLPLCASLFILGACRDEPPTAPRASPVRSQANLLLPGGDPPDPPGTFATTLSPTASNQGVGPVTLGNLAELTWVEVEASGLLDQYYSDAAVWQQELRGQYRRPWDPGGSFDWNAYCQGNVHVWGAQAGDKEFCRYDAPIPVTAVWIDTVLMKGDVKASWKRGPFSYSPGCDVTGKPPCYTYTGSFAITITPIAQYLELKATPSTIMSGDTVTFTASAPGKTFTIQEWIWQPDEPPITLTASANSRGSYNTQMAITGSSCGAGDVTCVRPIFESGTMYVRGIIDGRHEQAKAHVSVQPDILHLQANHSSVKPGEEVKFTAGTENGTSFTINSWAWDASSVAPSGKALTSVAACNSNNDCTIEVYEDGAMTVTATVAGATEPQDASASVAVTPCDSLGDPRLDDPAVRKKMADLLKQSMQDGHELGGKFYTNPTTGEHLIIPIPWTGSDPCIMDISGYPPSSEIPPGFVLDTADFHTHPLHQGDPVPANCNPSGIKSGNQWTTAGDGPSEYWKPDGTVGGDWHAEGLFGRAGYLMDADGHIHRWNHPDDDSLQDPSTWKRDGNSICFTV